MNNLLLYHRLILLFLFIPNSLYANSCLNIKIDGLLDQSGLSINDNYISAVGTLRIENEIDESKQPMFNISELDCQKSDYNKNYFICKLITAYVSAEKANPNSSNPNCTLNLDSSEFLVKPLNNEILSGVDNSIVANSGCFNTILTINQKTQRVYISYSRTENADKIEKTMPNMCKARQTQVLMNCTIWPAIRSSNKGIKTEGRYCDFSNSHSK